MSLEIQVDDLLSYLTEFWKPLNLRQTYPITSQPDRPSLLRSTAQRRWASEPDETIEREDALVSAFEEAHDLSRCFAGLFDLPPLWLVRQGDRMQVETRSSLRSVPFRDAQEALQLVGDEIALRLSETNAERWMDLVKAWQGRDRGDPAVLLAWATSLDRQVAQSLASDGVLEAPNSVAEAANDNDELRIAARMASALPPEQIRQIICLVQGFQKHEAAALDQLGRKVRSYIEQVFAKRRPFEQGEAAANFVRERLNITGRETIDIFCALEELGVTVKLERVEPSTLFALAVWGPSHGPTVLLNEHLVSPANAASDYRSNWLARVTLAHELCHLVLDQEHTLTAVDVLHSRMPPNIERRAKAFAGEFLLPAKVASERWQEARSPRSLAELDQFVLSLCRDYGVTKSVAAWKLEHGLQRIDVDLSVLLDAVVPGR